MYNFEQAPSRNHVNSIKWNVAPGELPMWIADMDFVAAPEIVDALQTKINGAIYGYEEPDEDFYGAIADWYAEQHHARPERDWLTFATGVVPAIGSILRHLAHAGDNVLVQAPVYNMFFKTITASGLHPLTSDLAFADGAYTCDYTDLAAKLALPATTVMILCNPHNPIGKVWPAAEVEHIVELCARNHVLLISDEIHGDLVLNGPAYTPAYSVPAAAAAQVVTLVAPSKTFNLAGLHAACAIIPAVALRSQVQRALNTDGLDEPNMVAMAGATAAYRGGAAWVAALKNQLRTNYQIASDFINQDVKALHVIESTATYLLWVDVSGLVSDSQELVDWLRAETGLVISAGNSYAGNGHTCVRINFACPETMLRDGLTRLRAGVNSFRMSTEG